MVRWQPRSSAALATLLSRHQSFVPAKVERGMFGMFQGRFLWRVVVKPYKNHTKTIQKPMENSKDTHDLTCFFSRNGVFYVYIIGTHW